MSDITFGQYLTQLREEKKMSQIRLSEVAGLINSTISRIEADAVKPDPVTIKKIAEALKIDKALLFVKCGYSNEIPEDFVIIARKTGELTEEQRRKAFKMFNETIDQLLLDENEEEE